MQSSLLVPVVGWQTGSTGESVELRISVESVCFLSIATGEHGFRLEPEQARQIIRDLSAAVLALDLKMLARRDDAEDGDARLREEADPDLSVETVFASLPGRPTCKAEVSTMTRPADIYLRFLQLAEALPGERSSLQPLDPLEERILMRVVRTAQDDERLSVRDLMAQSELGSPATLHGRLKSMRKKGWLQLADTDNSRRKQIELTEAAWRHFDRLSAYVMKALGGGDTAG
ncbi:MAG: hypothetical protein P4L40_27020 [Terracidiphilus sp.]|nr:hypothetical protein [Terracidiphilus sp.]